MAAGKPKNMNLPEIPAMNVKETRDVTLAAEQQRAITEVEASYLVAFKRPRDEERAETALEKAISRITFAEDAYYSFPRGDKEVFGPSINFAREFARVWGNIKYGFRVVHDDDESRTIEGFAIDLQWNTEVARQDTFKKLIQRRDPELKITKWIRPDERDLRELTSRHASIEMRNCVLQLAPKDIVDKLIQEARRNVKTAMKGEDITQVRKKTQAAFEELGIYVNQLEGYLKHPFDETTDDEIAELRGIFKAIKDGMATREEYFSPQPALKKTEPQAEETGMTLTKILGPETQEGTTSGLPPQTKPEGRQGEIPEFLPPLGGGEKESKKKTAKEEGLGEKITCPETKATVRKKDCIELCRLRNKCPIWIGKGEHNVE